MGFGNEPKGRRQISSESHVVQGSDAMASSDLVAVREHMPSQGCCARGLRNWQGIPSIP
jgi:hypothetical protein